MDSIKNAAENKLGKDSQPGNNVERSADNAVDQRTNHPLVALPTAVPLPSRDQNMLTRTSTEVNSATGSAGVPSSADGTINDAVNKEVNAKIPGGN